MNPSALDKWLRSRRTIADWSEVVLPTAPSFLMFAVGLFAGQDALSKWQQGTKVAVLLSVSIFTFVALWWSVVSRRKALWRSVNMRDLNALLTDELESPDFRGRFPELEPAGLRLSLMVPGVPLCLSHLIQGGLHFKKASMATCSDSLLGYPETGVAFARTQGLVGQIWAENKHSGYAIIREPDQLAQSWKLGPTQYSRVADVRAVLAVGLYGEIGPHQRLFGILALDTTDEDTAEAIAEDDDLRSRLRGWLWALGRFALMEGMLD